jgi:hypothetical protein
MQTTNNVAPCNRFVGVDPNEKERVRELYSQALQELAKGEKSLRKIADDYKIDRSTLSNLRNGKKQLGKIGSIGRQAVLTHAEEEGLLETMSQAGTRGQWRTREDFAAAALEYSINKGRFKPSQKPLSRTYTYGVAK